MCIDISTMIKLDKSLFSHAYKVFKIHNGKVHSPFAGKQLILSSHMLCMYDRNAYVSMHDGRWVLMSARLVVSGKTKKEQKKKLELNACIHNFDGNDVRYSEEHIGFISCFLDFKDAQEECLRDNDLIAVVYIPGNVKVKIGTMTGSTKPIILAEKVYINYFITRDSKILSSAEIKEKIEKSKEVEK